MTDQAIYNMLVKRATQAGVAHFSPHDLRRTMAGDLLDAGADIVTVQKMLAHASVQTTARYDRRPEQVKRRAANLIHVPYYGRRPNG
jgi:site-specific recombinase XerD